MAKKIELGDIYSIPLPDGKYAFGRIYRDGCIAIYGQISDSEDDIPPEENYQFVVGVYEHVLKSGQWKKVASRRFSNDEEAWPPPMCIIDSVTGGYSVYHKGKSRPSTREECSGFEEAAVWDANHIIDRIMGSDIWHKR